MGKKSVGVRQQWEKAADRVTDLPIVETKLSLAEFVRESWQVLEPSTELLWNWHIDVMCLHIQEALLDWYKHKQNPHYKQRIQNLLINVPPGSLKSRVVSVCTPAWFWTISPSWRAIFLSANPRVALRDSVYCRDIIESDWYQKRFGPDWALRDDNNSKTSFWNTKGGIRSAFGFNSRITGDRGDCLDASTPIETEHGILTIKQIFDNPAPIKVWSFDSRTGKVELRRVTAARKVLAKNSVRIITGDGKEIKCTHDHRFYTNQGYVTALSLKPGDTLRVWKTKEESFKVLPELLVRVEAQHSHPLLRTLWQGNKAPRLRGKKGKVSKQAIALLFENLSNGSNESIFEDPRLSLSYLWRGNEGVKWAEILFNRVHPQATTENGDLSVVRAGVPPNKQGKSGLQSPMLTGRALRQDDWFWQLSLQNRGQLRDVVRPHATRNFGERWRSLCGLRQAERNHNYQERTNAVNFGNPPYQQRQKGQQPRKLNHSLQQMPQVAPQLEHVTVSRVEFDCDISNYVYDIQVEGNHNFFANKILVHNCIIWDDPHDAQEVNSDLIRQGVLDRWDSAIRNRVNDLKSSIRIGIMQRLHEMDLSGHVLKKGGWEHLCVPQEFEKPQKPTALGWVDPRSEPGELMFPARFSPEIIQEEKKSLGSYGYAGQHQQQPAPADGGIFNRSWWRYYKVAPDDFEMIIQSWDCSFKDTKVSDYVVGQVWGKRGGQFYLLDQVRDRMDVVATIAAIRALSAKHPNSTAKLIEDKANGPAVISLLEREIPGLIAIEPEGGKKVRAIAIAPYVEAGNVFLPDSLTCSWVGDFVHEFSVFPNGSNDDQVDGCTQSLNWLASKVSYWGIDDNAIWSA